MRDQIRTPGFRPRQVTLVTTRLEATVYRADDRAAWYRLRWPVDPALAPLKTPRHRDVRHGQRVAGVLQELPICAMVSHLVRRVMRQSATLQHPAVARRSGLEARRWLSPPSTGLPLGALLVNPLRPLRVAPRVKKRRPKPCPLMLTPRHAQRPPWVESEPTG
jgi:putative transposase